MITADRKFSRLSELLDINGTVSDGLVPVGNSSGTFDLEAVATGGGGGEIDGGDPSSTFDDDDIDGGTP